MKPKPVILVSVFFVLLGAAFFWLTLEQDVPVQTETLNVPAMASKHNHVAPIEDQPESIEQTVDVATPDAEPGDSLDYERYDTPKTRVDLISPERQQVYRDCARDSESAFESSIFYGMNRATRESLANLRGDDLQGCASWYLATDYAARGDTQQAKLYSMMASLALDSPEPLIAIYENYWTAHEMRQTAIAYLMFAHERWPDFDYLTRTVQYFREEEIREAEQKINEVAEFASHVMAEHLGN